MDRISNEQGAVKPSPRQVVNTRPDKVKRDYTPY